MKYLLLCALLISGAFFSPVQADQSQCPDGGTYQVFDSIPMCTIPAGFGTLYTASSTSGKTVTSTDPSAALLGAVLDESITSSTDYNQTLTYTDYTIVYTYAGYQVVSQTSSSIAVQFLRTSVCTGWVCSNSGVPSTSPFGGNAATIIKTEQAEYCPPDNAPPGFINTYPVGDTFICWKAPAPVPECDCANFAGQSLNTRNTLRAPKGQYTNENPPQCVMQQEFVAGRDTPLTCTCQVSAQKWMKTNSGFENGVEYERWETLPTTQGQPSGTFTGVKCGATDGGPLEPENNAPKECFTLPNGVRWCWADKAEKCQVVNGVEQCSSGCGTVNGDFVCYEDTPVIPPKDRDQLTPPDDTLTDPNKPINEMVKSDFKQVNRGIETRLDNVVTSISNTTISMDEVSDKVGLTNSKLDGIGMQLDGVGKQLSAIDGKLDGAFGDKGQPMPGTGDGKNCHEEVCSWYESAYPDGLVGIWEERSLALQQTALFEFVNQFSFEPSGSQPEMQLCFNLASYANFGCFSLEIPAFVWVFLKVCILFSAAMLCRALIFGG